MANVRVHFYGLCLCVIDRPGDKVSVLLLNAGLSTERFPYHYPLLIAPSPSAVASDLAVLSELRGRVRGAHQLRCGIELAGWQVQIGNQQDGMPRMTRTSGLTHPTDIAGPWDDLGWIADLERINPGCALKSEYRSVGAHVLARIDLHGGTLTGGLPSNNYGASFVWSFSPGCQHAMTDSLIWEGVLSDDTLHFSSGPLVREVRLTGEGLVRDVWVSHEAGPIEQDAELALLKTDNQAYREMVVRPRLPHFSAFYDALQGGSYALTDAPMGTWRYDERPLIHYQDTPYCVLAQIVV